MDREGPWQNDECGKIVRHLPKENKVAPRPEETAPPREIEQGFNRTGFSAENQTSAVRIFAWAMDICWNQAGAQDFPNFRRHELSEGLLDRAEGP
jgi:hypothetical protein